MTGAAWAAMGFIAGPPALAVVLLAVAMFLFDFGGVLYGINYLSLRQAITPDRLMGRMTATMRFVGVAPGPVGALAGGALATAIGLRSTLIVVGALGLGLALLALTYSPVRHHRRLPATALE
jgi:hypothetical protein